MRDGRGSEKRGEEEGGMEECQKEGEKKEVMIKGRNKRANRKISSISRIEIVR